MAESTSTRDFAEDGIESTSIIDFALEGLGEAPAAAEWEKHRAAIDAIYLGKNLSVKAMVAVMKEEYGFDQRCYFQSCCFCSQSNTKQRITDRRSTASRTTITSL